MEIEIKERKEKEAAGKGREQRMKYKSVRERRSIAVAANFPNFANKLPETKILKRIVKVLTCSRPLQFIRASLPPFLADCVYLFSIPKKTFFSTTTCHSFRVTLSIRISSATESAPLVFLLDNVFPSKL